jgi:hypothetical protein
MILHNYVHVLTACDRVNLIQDGVIALDKPTSETSVQELTEIVVEEYRRARMAAALGNGASAAGNGAATAGDGAGAADSNPAATGNRAADESATTESPAAPAPPAADDAGDAGDKPGS